MATRQSLTQTVVAITSSKLDVLACGHLQACRHYSNIFAHPQADVVHADVVCEICQREAPSWPQAA